MSVGPERETSRSSPRLTPLAEALLVALSVFLLYLLFGQNAYYRIDGQVTLFRIARGTAPHPNHLLFDPLARGFCWLLDPLGISTYRMLVVFAAWMTSLALIPVHFSCRLLGLSRARTVLAMLLVGMAPSPFFYATVVEFHGVFLPFASLAFLAATAFGLRSTLLGALGLGFLSGLAYCVHASGNILPGMLLPWAIALARRGPHPSSWKRTLWLSGAAALSHGAFMLLLPASMRFAGLLPEPPDVSGFQASPSTAGISEWLGWLPGVDYLLYHFDTLRAEQLFSLPNTLLFEYLLPFLPASVLAFVAARRREGRVLAAGLLVALVPYLAGSFLLMRQENEFGAYSLPVLLPAAVIAAWAVPPRVLLAGVLVGLLVGAGRVKSHDRYPFGDRFARGLWEVSRGRPLCLITGNRDETHAALMHQQRPDVWDVNAPENMQALLTTLDQAFEIYKARGVELFLTEAAMGRLQGPSALKDGPRLLEQIRGRYRLEGGGSSSLRGFFLRRR